jgi:transposase InsO family protein
MLCTERQVEGGVISGMKRQQYYRQPGVLKTGMVEGKSVGDILAGDRHTRMAELLHGETEDSRKAEEAFTVSTRAQEKMEKEGERQKCAQEEMCGVQPSPVDEVWMKEMDGSLFTRSKAKKRKEKCEEKHRREQLQVNLVSGPEEVDAEERKLDADINLHELDISAKELKALQGTDIMLGNVRKSVKTRDGLLYRRWIPSGCSGVLPKKCREAVLKLAHSIPLAGHLGRDKTTRRILQRFYWPTVHRDVAEYCRGCDACQKTAGKKVPKAPLIPLPVISQPFERIAMDIVGPLQRSGSGNRFVLVVCDYATRYPEAVPMKHIDAASVAEELVKIFSRVGVPKEILTDQGTNFTSHLLTELYRMLHVRPIRTTPYHPQTDGLVERFNSTLKLMLRKTAVKEGVDWDVMLPYLLFAYREVPQASTGFSPFELLYGHHVRGPLDVLSETWQSSTRSEESVVSHVLSIRDKLEKMKCIADVNLEQAQLQQKRWYDKNARKREFRPDDMVLLLLPTASSKLLAQWQGPFRVVKKVGHVNYEIEMPHRRKKRQIYHTNLLKKWEPPSVLCSMASEVDDEEDDFPDWREVETSQPTFGSQLTDTQRNDLTKVLDDFKDVLQGKPGQTHVTEHTINTDANPIRLPPYRIPYAYREEVTKELQEMEESGIIEPSHSEWASPIVVARKKDGGIRLCVDYRKLNASTPMDAYPMPRTDELLDKLGNAKYISTLDLARGYWQVPMAEKDRAKTAFITPKGLYQFRVMPFGLNGAPATFQRMMDEVVRGLESFSGDYLDDIAIFSDTWEEHLRHIREVLLCLRKSNLTAKPRKCQFGMHECVYLEFMVGNGQVKPDPMKLKAVEKYPVPVTKKQVRGLLGLTGVL